jgi:ABC-type histidine transport system ATPase subunit
MRKKSNRFSPEVRERAVRLVLEHRGQYPSLWATIESIAPKIGFLQQTLNEWVQSLLMNKVVEALVIVAQNENEAQWMRHWFTDAKPMQDL